MFLIKFYKRIKFLYFKSIFFGWVFYTELVLTNKNQVPKRSALERSQRTIKWRNFPLFPTTSRSLTEVTKEGGVQCILCAVKAARLYIRQKVMEKKEIHLKRYLPKEMGEEMNSSRLDSVFK